MKSLPISINKKACSKFFLSMRRCATDANNKKKGGIIPKRKKPVIYRIMKPFHFPPITIITTYSPLQNQRKKNPFTPPSSSSAV